MTAIAPIPAGRSSAWVMLSKSIERRHSTAISREAQHTIGKHGTTGQSEFQSYPTEREIAALLFANRADLKVNISRIAMHLTEAQRRDLLKQIDHLLDAENWAEDDSLIDGASFRTFLRFMIFEGRIKRPALTVGIAGNIAANWIGEGFRLSIEFLKGDRVRCVCRRLLSDKDSELSAYEGPMTRLDAILSPFDGEQWYRNEPA